MPCNPQILKSSKNSVKTFARLSSAICLALSANVFAVNQVYTASAIATDGSSGTVSFTIDSSIAATGSNINDLSCGAAASNLKAFSLTMTGGSVPSGSQTWTCANVSRFLCTGSVGATTPCGSELNFSANNSSAGFNASGPKTATANWLPGKAIMWGAVSVAAPPPTNAPIDLHFSKQVESYSTEIELK